MQRMTRTGGTADATQVGQAAGKPKDGALYGARGSGCAAILIACGILLVTAGAGYAQKATEKKADKKADVTGKSDVVEEAAVESSNQMAVVTGEAATGLRIRNVALAPRDADSATVTFDMAWTNSWRYGNAFDAVWVFFKVRGDGGWEHARLLADKVLNPAGFVQEQGGTPLEFVVPEDRVGLFVRRAGPGDGLTSARKVTAVLDRKALKGVTDPAKASIKAIGIEMVFIPEGAFYVGRGNGLPAKFAGKGSGGTEQNWLYKHNGKAKDTAVPLPWRNGGDVDSWAAGMTRADPPPFRIESENAIPTGTKKGALWAVNFTPEDGGELPAAFPKGFAAFYSMKRIAPTAGQYAEFLNTLTEAQAKKRFYPHGHGMNIRSDGVAPADKYSAPDPDTLTQWLSFTDGAVFAAWAGLRPSTELEFEKMYRGVRPAIPNDAMPSCYGVGDTGVAGVYERPVSIASATGRTFQGTHGLGVPEPLPADWPTDLRGAILRSDYFYGAAWAPVHLLIGGRMNAVTANADRHGFSGTGGGPHGGWTFAGWRGARTSPAGDAAVAPVTGELDVQVRRLPRLSKSFQLDGALDEWAELKPVAVLDSSVFLFPVHERYPSVFTKTWWHGPKDFSAKAWLATDGTALLLAAEVTDDRQRNEKTGNEIYIGDCMQIGLVNQEAVQWNLGAALTSNGVAVAQFDGPNEALLKSGACVVKRDDAAGVTRYEWRLPFADFGVGSEQPCVYYFNFFDDDGNMTVKRNGNELLPVPQVRRLQWGPERTEPFLRPYYPKFDFAP
jgi:hypothetical protein